MQGARRRRRRRNDNDFKHEKKRKKVEGKMQNTRRATNNTHTYIQHTHIQQDHTSGKNKNISEFSFVWFCIFVVVHTTHHTQKVPTHSHHHDK